MSAVMVSTLAVVCAVGAAIYLRFIEPHTWRWVRVTLDGLGVFALLPALLLFWALTDVHSGGQMTGFAALLIYSVVSLGIVPLFGLICVMLVFRLMVRVKWGLQRALAPRDLARR